MKRMGWMTMIAAVAGGVCAADAPRLLAHRGGVHEYDENTLGAFKACYENGLRGFETDFRMTKDGRIVILHDDTLNRTTDGTGHVEAMTADEVKKIRTKKSGEPLPFIEDFVAYFKDKPDVFAELEMKTSNKTLYPDERLEAYCDLMHTAAQGLPEGSYCFTSFDHRVLRTMKRLHPDAPTGLIVGGALNEKQLALAKELKVQQIAPVMDDTTRKAVRAAQKAGFKLTGWPTVSEADYALGVAMGYDNLTTDIPVRLFRGVAKPK
jgi:glycerophosphoryl diester phosphodiesterase